MSVTQREGGYVNERTMASPSGGHIGTCMPYYEVLLPACLSVADHNVFKTPTVLSSSQDSALKLEQNVYLFGSAVESVLYRYGKVNLF